jgi:pimeloyl-ACP methyl ester carboxylesterase
MGASEQERHIMEIIRSKDGTPIAYWHSGVGTRLLLVHGTTGDHLTWTPVLAALEHHFSVYTMDRRGRGHSGDADAYALEREWEDIAAVIDVIGDAVDVVGHSFGGTCALEATHLTANVRRLILYEPPMPFGRQYWPTEFSVRMQAFLDAREREQALLLFFRDMVKMPSHEVAAAQTLPTWPARVAAVHTIPRELRSLDRYVFDPGRFGRMETPTALLLGGDSPPSMRTIAETLHTALPNSQIVVLPGQQHVAMRTAPDLFVQEVVKFFTAAPAG